MWKSKKKVILIAVLVVTLVLAATIGGVALAQTTDNTTPDKTLFGRVATILGINQQTLENAVTTARKDMQTGALTNYLNGLVANGKITQAQADEYMTWWKSRPDMSQYQQQLKEWMQARPGIPSEFKNWEEARPDVPLSGFGIRGFRGGMKMGRGLRW